MSDRKNLFRATDFRRKIDVDNQIIYPDLTLYITHPNGRKEKLVESLSLKYYYYEQIKQLLISNNFNIVSEFGNYDKREIQQGPEQIFICKK